MRTVPIALFCLVFGLAARAETINVAAAISLKESLTEIAKAFEADTGERVDFTFGASGQLMAQIKTGSPIDAFISAAGKQVDDLDQLRLIDAGTRRNVAGNELVLIAPANAPPAFSDF